MLKLWDRYSDVRVQHENEVTVSYRTANMVCEEGLRDGMWVSLSYNASGYMMDANPLPEPSYMKYDLFSRPQSFQLNIFIRPVALAFIKGIRKSSPSNILGKYLLLFRRRHTFFTLDLL